MNIAKRVRAELRLFHARGAQAIIPTVLTLAVSGLSLMLIAIIIARSPYTHSNLSPGGYNRTEVTRVGDIHAFAGMPLANPADAHTGDDVHDGRVLFEQFGCALCHGLNGQGQTVGPNLRTATTAKIEQQVRKGPGHMPAFSTDLLSEDDLAKVIAFLTSKQAP